MRALHAILALLLTAPVLGASALDPPEAATTPLAMGTDDSCLSAVVPPAPSAVPCVDVPLLVDEGGDTMTGDLRLDNGAGLDFASGSRLAGVSATSLRYGARAVCLASVAATGCGDIEGVTAGTGLSGSATSGTAALSVDTAVIQRRVATTCAAGSAIRAVAADGTVTCETDDGQVYTGTAPITVSGTAVGLSTTGCVAGEAWLWSGTAWACSDVATEAELDALDAGVLAAITGINSTISATRTELTAVKAEVTSLQNQVNAVNSELDSAVNQLQTAIGTGDAALQAQDNQLSARINALDADVNAHETEVTQLQADMTSAKASIAALDAHGHGLAMQGVGATLVNGTSAAALASISVTTPDKCSGAETHRYFVQASGNLQWTNTGGTYSTSFHRLSLSADSTAHGSGSRYLVADDINEILGWHGMATFSLSPGSHTFRLVASKEGANYNGAYLYGDLAVQHLGWTCT